MHLCVLAETEPIRFDTDSDSKPVAKGGRPSMPTGLSITTDQAIDERAQSTQFVADFPLGISLGVSFEDLFWRAWIDPLIQ